MVFFNWWSNVKYVNQTAQLEVGQLAVHFFNALSLSRFFLNWARPYGDEKQIIVVEHWYRDTVCILLNTLVNH